MRFFSQQVTSGPYLKNGKQIQRAFKEKGDPKLPEGTSCVFIVEDEFLSERWYLKRRPIKTSQELDHHSVFNETDFIVSPSLSPWDERPLAAESFMPRRSHSTPLIREVFSKEATSFANKEKKTTESVLLANQLEVAVGDIAYLLNPLQFPKIKPADNWHSVISVGFEEFISVADLIKQGRSRNEICAEFAKKNGGSVAAVFYFLMNDDVNQRNIGTNGDLVVGIDSGNCLAPIYYDLTSDVPFHAKALICDAHAGRNIQLKVRNEKHFARNSQSIRVEDAFAITESVLANLPLSSCDDQLVERPWPEELLSIGYSPYNSFETCFDWGEKRKSNVKAFLKSDPLFRKDLLIQLLIGIIIYELGLIEKILNYRDYDKLLRERILNLISVRFLNLKDLLFNPNSNVHQEIKALVSTQELNEALKKRIDRYNKDINYPLRLNFQYCQSKVNAVADDFKLHQTKQPIPREFLLRAIYALLKNIAIFEKFIFDEDADLVALYETLKKVASVNARFSATNTYYKLLVTIAENLKNKKLKEVEESYLEYEGDYYVFKKGLEHVFSLARKWELNITDEKHYSWKKKVEYIIGIYINMMDASWDDREMFQANIHRVANIELCFELMLKTDQFHQAEFNIEKLVQAFFILPANLDKDIACLVLNCLLPDEKNMLYLKEPRDVLELYNALVYLKENAFYDIEITKVHHDVIANFLSKKMLKKSIDNLLIDVFDDEYQMPSVECERDTIASVHFILRELSIYDASFCKENLNHKIRFLLNAIFSDNALDLNSLKILRKIIEDHISGPGNYQNIKNIYERLLNLLRDELISCDDKYCQKIKEIFKKISDIFHEKLSVSLYEPKVLNKFNNKIEKIYFLLNFLKTNIRLIDSDIVGAMINAYIELPDIEHEQDKLLSGFILASCFKQPENKRKASWVVPTYGVLNSLYIKHKNLFDDEENETYIANVINAFINLYVEQRKYPMFCTNVDLIIGFLQTNFVSAICLSQEELEIFSHAFLNFQKNIDLELFDFVFSYCFILAVNDNNVLFHNLREIYSLIHELKNDEKENFNSLLHTGGVQFLLDVLVAIPVKYSNQWSARIFNHALDFYMQVHDSKTSYLCLSYVNLVSNFYGDEKDFENLNKDTVHWLNPKEDFSSATRFWVDPMLQTDTSGDSMDLDCSSEDFVLEESNFVQCATFS